MNVAAIFPVGTSIGGCPVAIKQILELETALCVHLIFGRRGDADKPNPLDVTNQIQLSCADSRLVWKESQEVEPWDLSLAYRQVREFIERIANLGYHRVYVGITGATNPINASLFQTAMAYLHCEVVPIYVQWTEHNAVQYFSASDIRDQVTAAEAIGTARSGQIRVAAKLAERLPNEGKWKFVKVSLAALSDWDDFDYPKAAHTLKQQSRDSGRYGSDLGTSAISSTVSRIAALSNKLVSFVSSIRDPNCFAVHVAKPLWSETVQTGGQLLVSDALSNASRRLAEGRFTDCALRSYRAVECASQIALISLGLHPSRLNAFPAAFRRYSSDMSTCIREKNQVALWEGLRLLDKLQKIEFAKIEFDLRSLSQCRNESYLEHGYNRVDQTQAKMCFCHARSICEHILGGSLEVPLMNARLEF